MEPLIPENKFNTLKRILTGDNSISQFTTLNELRFDRSDLVEKLFTEISELTTSNNPLVRNGVVLCLGTHASHSDLVLGYIINWGDQVFTHSYEFQPSERAELIHTLGYIENPQEKLGDRYEDFGGMLMAIAENPDEDTIVRSRAAQTLGRLEFQPAKDLLTTLAECEFPAIANQAKDALRALQKMRSEDSVDTTDLASQSFSGATYQDIRALAPEFLERMATEIPQILEANPWIEDQFEYRPSLPITGELGQEIIDKLNGIRIIGASDNGHNTQIISYSNFYINLSFNLDKNDSSVCINVSSESMTNELGPLACFDLSSLSMKLVASDGKIIEGYEFFKDICFDNLEPTTRYTLQAVPINIR